MQTPLQITAHDMTLSEAVETEIREKAAKLELFYKRMISCHVVVGAPVRSAHASHNQTGLYNVSIDITVPGTELVVTRQANEDLLVAIRDAFNAAQRQLQDYAHRQRGDVKTPETPPQAIVSKLFAKEGYGFLATSDGREIYFHPTACWTQASTNWVVVELHMRVYSGGYDSRSDHSLLFPVSESGDCEKWA